MSIYIENHQKQNKNPGSRIKQFIAVSVYKVNIQSQLLSYMPVMNNLNSKLKTQYQTKTNNKKKKP